MKFLNIYNVIVNEGTIKSVIPIEQKYIFCMISYYFILYYSLIKNVIYTKYTRNIYERYTIDIR